MTLHPPQQPLTPQTYAETIDEEPKQCFCAFLFLLFEIGVSDHVARQFRKCSISDMPQSSKNNCRSSAAI
jgi:hypothetical protein